MAIDRLPPLPPYISKLIEVTATKMLGHYGSVESDWDDLVQQISLEVVRRRARFDRSLAQEHTFLARLVRHAAADIIAARKASNRDFRREDGSMNQWIRDDDGLWVLRADTITEEQAGRRTGWSSTSAEELCDLAIDMAAAAASLPDGLRGIYEQMKAHATVREIADAMGVHRSTVYDAIRQIRRRFEEDGMGEYLPTTRPDPTDSDGRW